MQALASNRAEDPDVETELQALLADLQETRVSSGRWLNWDMLARIELNALDAWSRNVSDGLTDWTFQLTPRCRWMGRFDESFRNRMRIWWT